MILGTLNWANSKHILSYLDLWNCYFKRVVRVFGRHHPPSSVDSSTLSELVNELRSWSSPPCHMQANRRGLASVAARGSPQTIKQEQTNKETDRPTERQTEDHRQSSPSRFIRVCDHRGVRPPLLKLSGQPVCNNQNRRAYLSRLIAWREMSESKRVQHVNVLILPLISSMRRSLSAH